MPIVIEYNGHEIEFPDNTTDAEIESALRELFPTDFGEKKKEPTKGKIYQGVGSKDFEEGSQGGSLDFGKNAGLRKAGSGSLDSEPNPIVSDLKRLQETKLVKKESPKQQSSQDLRKVETSNPNDALASPEKEFEAKADIATTQQGEFYDIEKRKANAPRRVDLFEIGTDEYNDALVRDKIDYLWNVGEKDAANQLKETYDEILAEKGSGDLSRGQSERYRELITQAQVENNEYVEKELRVVDSRYKVKDFYKGNASTIQELNELVSELSQGVSDERRVVLESQISALQGILGDSMGKTGITSDVLEAYSNIAGKFVDPRIVYDKATTESLKSVEGKNTIGAERQAEVERMNMSSNPIGAIGTGAHRAVDAFSETVVNGALSIVMQAPKVFGDMVGDTDYDFIDEMYDKASGLKAYVSEEMSWGDEKEAPTYMMLSRVLGQAAGSMYTMSGGGVAANMIKATQTATKAGTFGATMTMQMADNYEGALAEGMSQQEAALFGTWSSILSATIEQIVPEGVQPMKFTRLRDAIKEGVRGKELAEVALGSYAEYSLNVAKEMGEEVFEAAVGDINKQLAGYNPENLFSSKEYKEAILGAAMIGGSMTAMRSKKSRPFMVAEMLYDIAEVNESNLPSMSKEDMKTQKEMHEIRVSLEAVPSWNDMSREDRVIAFDAMVRKNDLEAAQKDVGESDGGQIAAEIEKVDAELKELLAPKAKEEAPIEETEVSEPEVAAEPTIEAAETEIKEEFAPENEIDTQTTKIDEQSDTSELQGSLEEANAGGGELDASGELQEVNEGGVEGERDIESDQPKPVRTASDVEKVVRTRDERIGQILYDDSEQGGSNDQGDGGLGGSEGGSSVLEDRNEPRPQAGEQVDGSNDNGGDGESKSPPKKLTERARIKLEGRVNDLLGNSKVFNKLNIKARQANAGQNKLKEIQKEAKKLGLEVSYLGGKVKITKGGKRVLPRGTKGQAIEDEKVFKRAMKEDSDDLDMNVFQRVYNGLAVTPEFFIKEFGHDKDSTEYKGAKRAGFIRNDGVTDFSKYATEQMENKDVDGNGITYDPFKVQEAVRLAMTHGSKANLKKAIIDAQKSREAKAQKSEEQSKFESDVIDIVNAAKAEFEASGKDESERIDYVENAIRRLSRNKDLFEDSSVEREALSSYRNEVAVLEREKNYVPYDTDDVEFSLGGEDAPFQESEDKGIEAINIFYDAYENGDLGDAIEAAMDFVDANPEARETFEKHLKENRSDLVAGKKKAKKIASVKSREDFKKAVNELVPQISDEDIERLAVVGDAMVKYVLKLDPSLTTSEAWEQVQGHITNDLSKLNGGLKQESDETRDIIENAKANGTFMQAPNGQPTKLNESQWVQVRTKAFKDWFGDWEIDPKNASKVVDENGEPMVVYHYSASDFEVFDKKKSPKNNSLVENKAHKALGFDFSTREGFYKSGSRGKVYEVFLNVRNPFNPSVDKLDKVIQVLKNLVYYKNKPFELSSDIKLLKEGYWGIIELPSVDRFLSKNYDSAYMTENGWRNIKVYSPNQIKSATGNNGDFSVNSNNILEQGVKGATSIEQGITAYTEAAEVSTLIHEPAHNFLGLLEYMAANGNAKAAEHIKAVDDFAKSGEGKKFFDRSKAAGETWAQGEFNENDPTLRQELFARSAEKYFMEGEKAGFSKRMAEVFESFSKFLKELYKGIKSSPEHIELSDEMRSLFDALYGNDTTKKLDEVVTTTKLRNVIRAFVENSNLPQKDKDRLASDPKNITDKFEFDEMEKLVDDMIATYGIDAIRDEAMKEHSAIPLELKSIVYGRALMDLRARIKTASGQELIALTEIHDEIYSIGASTALSAGRYTAYFARIYSQDPEAVAKSIRNKMEKQHGYGKNLKRAEDAAKEIKEELDKDEDMSELLENGDVLDIIEGLKRNEKKEAAVRKKIEVLKKEQEIVATAVTLKIDGKVPTRQRAIAKTRANEAAKKFRDSMKGKGSTSGTNVGINASAIPYAIEWGAWELIGKAMDFSTFMNKGIKVLGKDAESMMGEIYKESVKRLRAEGYDVSALTDDAGVDKYMEMVNEQIALMENLLAQKEMQSRIAKLSSKMVSRVGGRKANKTDLFAEAAEIDAERGNSDMTDLVASYTEMKASEKKARKSKSLLDRFEKRMSYDPSQRSKTRSLEDIAEELDKEYNTTEYSERVRDKREQDAISKSENKEIRDFERRATNVWKKKDPKEVKSLRAAANELDKKHNTNKYSAMVDAKERRDKARKDKERKDKAYDKFMTEFDKDVPNYEKLKQYGKDYESISGSSSLLDAALEIEKKQVAEQESKDKAAKDAEYAKMLKEVNGELNTKMKKLFSMMSSRLPSSKKTEGKSMRELAKEIDAKRGNTEMTDLVDNYETEKASSEAKEKSKKELDAKKRQLSTLMSERVKSPKVDKENRGEKIQRLAAEIDQQEGGSTYTRLVDSFNEDGKDFKSIIKKALLDAGFGQKDLDGNDTGKIDWKRVASDSKNVDETVSKIMDAVKDGVLPADLPLIEKKLRDAVTSLVMDKKQKAIDQFIRNRQTAAERKLRGKGTRKTRIDKLMDLHNMGGTSVKDVVDAIFEDFGVAKYTLEDDAYLKAWGKAKKKAMDAGRHIEAAELDEKLQNFMDARSSPIFSGDRFQSDYIQGLLASFVSWKQNASNLIDTLGFSAIWDTLSAQVKFVNGKPVLGDKYAIKMLRASFGKAMITALDQVLYGGIDVISAQQFKTGNRESAPQVRFYERSRRETGQRGVRSNADNFRQKLIRIIPRLNAATDALGGVVTQEMKTYLLIREMYIDEGVPFHEAAQKAWDAMNHEAFQDAFRQANNENPNENLVRKKRRAYEILEENAYKKGGKENFRRGQLAANIANLKSFELGLLSGVGAIIDDLSKKLSTAFKQKALAAETTEKKYFWNAIDFFVGKPLSMLTMFLKPTFNVLETSLKYAAFSNPALTAYTAARLLAMGVANQMGHKEYDLARGMKDAARGLVGFVLAALMGFDDEDEDDTKLVGVGPKNPFEALSEGEQAALNSWNGVSIKNLGPMMMPAYIAAIDGNNKRYREAMDTFSIVNMMSLGSYTEGIARFYNNAKNKTIEESLMEVMIARLGQIINPLRRMTNDFQNVFNEKQKPITNRDLFLKTVGLVSMIGRPTIDAYGNTYYEGRTNKYTMDATLGLKHVYENAERDKKINDYRAKYNVPISSLVKKDFGSFFDKQLAEVMSDELRYEIAKYANPMRGIVYSNYVDRYPNGQYGEPTKQEIDDVVSAMPPETKTQYDNGNLVIYREYNAIGEYGLKVDNVSNDVKGVASRDLGLFGLDYASQIRKSYIETKVAGEFSKLNDACNKYGRFKAAKEMKLDMALLYDWTEIAKEMKLLNEYGAKFE
jgi:ADP-Ribosyltransferase in polyvalent proteins